MSSKILILSGVGFVTLFSLSLVFNSPGYERTVVLNSLAFLLIIFISFQLKIIFNEQFIYYFTLANLVGIVWVVTFEVFNLFNFKQIFPDWIVQFTPQVPFGGRFLFSEILGISLVIQWSSLLDKRMIVAKIIGLSLSMFLFSRLGSRAGALSLITSMGIFFLVTSHKNFLLWRWVVAGICTTLVSVVLNFSLNNIQQRPETRPTR